MSAGGFGRASLGDFRDRHHREAGHRTGSYYRKDGATHMNTWKAHFVYSASEGGR